MENSMPNCCGMFVVTPGILIQVLLSIRTKHLQMEGDTLLDIYQGPSETTSSLLISGFW